MIDRLDHLVLTVASIDASIAFYVEVLGMAEISFGDGRKALSFGRQKINLHEVGRDMKLVALRPTAGSGDLCLIAAGPLADMQAHVESRGVAIEVGPVVRSGATGPIRSIYFRDPDGNLVEVSTYDV